MTQVGLLGEGTQAGKHTGLKTVRRVLGEMTTASLVKAFVISRLDLCNSILAELPKSSIMSIQRVQNASARPIRALGKLVHVTT